MKHSTMSIIAGLSTLGAGLICQSAHAQFGPPNQPLRSYPMIPGYASPQVSNYLNLVQRGTSPGIQYYGIVRPQNTFSASIQGLGQNQQQLASQQTSLNQAAGLPDTGHTVAFMNTSHYFRGMSSSSTGLNRGSHMPSGQQSHGGTEGGSAGGSGQGGSSSGRTR